MSRLFATQTRPNFLHSFKNISVSDLGLLHLNSVLLRHQKESQIAHYSRNNGVICKLAVFFHMVTDNRHNLIAIHHITQFIHCKKSVRITVKGKTNICLFINNPCLQLLHMRRATVRINIGAIRHIMNGYNICTKFPDCFYGSIVRSSLRTVNHDLESCEINVYGLD